MKIAIVGGGVAGIVSAHGLSKHHEVELFEGGAYLGGHTNTVVLESGPDAGIGIDTGFIVCNDKNYPHFHTFLRELGVPVRWSDMSFSHYCEQSGLQYAGTTLNGLFAQRSNLFSSQFYSFLFELYSFCRQALKDLSQGQVSGTFGEYLDEVEASEYLRENYLLPMGAAIWSAPLDDILEFPAESFLHFFRNHGLLSFRDRPRWQTVVGGSHAYVKKFKETFSGTVHIGRPIKSIQRTESGVLLRDADSVELHFDAVVIAAHADQAIRLLSDPSKEEQRLLGAWRYQENKTYLHTDTSLLPPNRRAWASWNYMRFADVQGQSPVSVTYDMNRLQGIYSDHRYCVTLNPARAIRDELLIKEINYMHPVFDAAAMGTQSELPSLNGVRNTYYCGSYFGYGFHEDAVRSAVDVVKKIDV